MAVVQLAQPPGTLLGPGAVQAPYEGVAGIGGAERQAVAADDGRGALDEARLWMSGMDLQPHCVARAQGVGPFALCSRPRPGVASDMERIDGIGDFCKGGFRGGMGAGEPGLRHDRAGAPTAAVWLSGGRITEGSRRYTAGMDIPKIPARWYAILGRDAEGAGPARAAARPAHLARLQVLADAGRLKVAGPLPRVDGLTPAEGGVTGSLLVAAFDDLDVARAWAAEDPYVAAGVYASVEVQPFLPVLP